VRFLVDAHLPPSLAAALSAAGHDAVHTRELPAQNRTRDGAINELSLSGRRVVISKDTDFFYSHILQGRPWKLLLVRTGNIGSGELCALFLRHLPAILDALETHSLVEIDRQTVTPLR
jgi:predicted nuclease of predicted toxin-antitoxin system